MMSLASVPLAYPEILLSLACFLLFAFLAGGKCGSSLPTNWPLLGMLPGLVSQLHRFHDWATDVLRESGCTFRAKGLWFSGMDILATCDPANINYVFNTNFANYPKGAEFLDIFDILGEGIFNADSDSWKNQRKVAHMLISEPRFRQLVARTSRTKVETGLIPVLANVAEHTTNAVDLHDVFLRYTFDTTCNMVFGVDPGCLSPRLPTVPFAKAMDDAEEVLFYRHTVPRSWWKLLRRLRVGQEKKMALACETIDHFIACQITKRMEGVIKAREDKGRNEEGATDLLTSYLRRQPGDVGDIAVEAKKFLRDTTLNFMLAGRDTTGVALTWFFWLISQHPKVEEKILDELTAALQKKPESCRPKPVVFDVEDLGTAVYLQAALYESLRLFPPVPFEHKGALKPDVLPSGDRVDPDTKVLFFLYAMGRMEGIWGEDCCEFKPERWISESGRLRHEPSYKFLSFNSGPRTCLGKDMAFTQMKVVAATVIHNFRIKLVEGHVVVPKLSIILHMKNGLLVRVENRGT